MECLDHSPQIDLFRLLEGLFNLKQASCIADQLRFLEEARDLLTAIRLGRASFGRRITGCASGRLRARYARRFCRRVSS